MRETEFAVIKYFSKNEIETTGANLDDVKSVLIKCLDTLRSKIERRIRLIKNGLTTGNHKAEEHLQGIACDFYLDEKDGIVDPEIVFKAALGSEFKGIGIYWNGNIFSFHVDLRKHYAFWSGTKTENESNWTYSKLFKNPKQEA